MSEKRVIEIFNEDDPPPDDHRTVAGYDSFVELWVEAVYLPEEENWIDAEGVNYRKGQITKWFDFPVENEIQILEAIS